nr:hypothetical protein WG33_0396 [uncultured bacterium]
MKRAIVGFLDAVDRVLWGVCALVGVAWDEWQARKLRR